MNNTILSLCTLAIAWLLVACAPTGRYHQHHDSAPKIIPKNVTTVDATPQYEAYAPANMRPYTIRGVRYTPLFKSKGFTEQGKASWYGEKFHGHLTANGEIYDMYQMSAAHKTLPIPSFAKVTNQANGKQVIVRVNDRGPFHGGRIIDLSYAAALKLDMLKTGVADVKLEVVKVTADGEIISANRTKLNISNGKTSKRLFIQVAAFQDKPKIQNLGLVLQTLYQLPHQITTQQDIHKLQIGPLGNEQEAGQLLQELKRNGYPGAYKILLD